MLNAKNFNRIRVKLLYHDEFKYAYVLLHIYFNVMTSILITFVLLLHVQIHELYSKLKMFRNDEKFFGIWDYALFLFFKLCELIEFLSMEETLLV